MSYSTSTDKLSAFVASVLARCYPPIHDTSSMQVAESSQGEVSSTFATAIAGCRYQRLGIVSIESQLESKRAAMQGGESVPLELSAWPIPPAHRHPLASPSDVACFKCRIKTWRAETAFWSSSTQRSMHPSYQQIIGMGKPAVGLLLEELDRDPDWYFWALQSITGENPVPMDSAGDFRAMRECWLRWGAMHGYLSFGTPGSFPEFEGFSLRDYEPRYAAV